MASSTTEGQAGGNVRSSEAAIEHDGEQVTLERKATVISYAVEADGIVTTARRAADAAGQRSGAAGAVEVRLHARDGCRCGIPSACAARTARASRCAHAPPADQILPEPYEKIHAQTMVPFAHLLWGSVWAGIAAAATAKAQAFVRHAMRQSNGQMPPGAAHFTQAVSTLRTLRGVLATSLRSYEAIMSDEKAISSLEFQSMITLTKVQVSELAVTTVLHALRACGLSGYRNDTEFTIGRLLRDVLSAPIMINNDRILTNLATTVVDDAAAGFDQRLMSHAARQRILVYGRLAHLADRAVPADGRGRRLCAHRAVCGPACERLEPTSPRQRDPQAEVMRFPPVMSRKQLEKSGYLKSFPESARLRLRAARLRGLDSHRRRTP